MLVERSDEVHLFAGYRTRSWGLCPLNGDPEGLDMQIPGFLRVSASAVCGASDGFANVRALGPEFFTAKQAPGRRRCRC